MGVDDARLGQALGMRLGEAVDRDVIAGRSAAADAALVMAFHARRRVEDRPQSVTARQGIALGKAMDEKLASQTRRFTAHRPGARRKRGSTHFQAGTRTRARDQRAIPTKRVGGKARPWFRLRLGSSGEPVLMIEARLRQGTVPRGPDVICPCLSSSSRRTSGPARSGLPWPGSRRAGAT